MTRITLYVRGAEIRAVCDGDLTAGAVGIPVKVVFDSAWDELTPKVYFRSAKKDVQKVTVPMVLIDGMTTVPPETLIADKDLLISIDGWDAEGALRIPTKWVFVQTVSRSADDTKGLPPIVPTPGIVDQILAKADAAEQRADGAVSVANEAKQIADAVKQAADNGEFIGPKGDDYVLTDEDKQEIAGIAAELVPEYDDSEIRQEIEGKSTVQFAQGAESGTLVGTITIDGEETEMYAPTPNTKEEIDGWIDEATSDKYIKPETGIPESDLSEDVQAKLNIDVSDKYVKPAAGIPESDLDESVQEKLNNSSYDDSEIRQEIAGKSAVQFEQGLTSGSQVGTITIDGESKTIYAPTPNTKEEVEGWIEDAVSDKYVKPDGGIPASDLDAEVQAKLNDSYDDSELRQEIAEKSAVQFEQTMESGAEIGKITIDGTSTTLYAPTSYDKDTIDGFIDSKLEPIEDVLAGKTVKTRIDYNGNKTFTMNGETLNFKQLHDIHLNDPDFAFIVYGDRAYLLSYVQDDPGAMRELRFESVIAVTSGGLSYTKTSGIYVLSSDGVNIANVTVTDINSENKAYKAAEITDSNKNNATMYPSVKATADYVDDAIEDLIQVEEKPEVEIPTLEEFTELEGTVNDIKGDLTALQNTGGSPAPAGKVWTATASGAGWEDPQGGETVTDQHIIDTITNDGFYKKPADGIPEDALSTDVRQKLNSGGTGKEWRHVGTIVDHTDVVVDLTGCTELLICGLANCNAAYNLTSNIGYLAISAFRQGWTYIGYSWSDEPFGIMCDRAWYTSGNANPTGFNTAGNGVSNIGKSVKDITFIKIGSGNGGVISADVKIYAR